MNKTVMADTTGVSKSTVHRIWTAFNIQPHRQKHFKLSTDPFFAEKVRDIVGLYLNPPDNAMVLCVDEKSQTQALERTQPLLPLGLGYVEGVRLPSIAIAAVLTSVVLVGATADRKPNATTVADLLGVQDCEYECQWEDCRRGHKLIYQDTGKGTHDRSVAKNG